MHALVLGYTCMICYVLTHLFRSTFSCKCTAVTYLATTDCVQLTWVNLEVRDVSLFARIFDLDYANRKFRRIFCHRLMSLQIVMWSFRMIPMNTCLHCKQLFSVRPRSPIFLGLQRHKEGIAVQSNCLTRPLNWTSHFVSCSVQSPRCFNLLSTLATETPKCLWNGHIIASSRNEKEASPLPNIEAFQATD